MKGENNSSIIKGVYYRNPHQMFDLADAIELILECEGRIICLEKELKMLKDEVRKSGATKEYRMMMRLGKLYTPPDTLNKNECDFTQVGDMIICSQCHQEFFTEGDFIPPYCPHCFAKREEDG